jgi:hypothetical protein
MEGRDNEPPPLCSLTTVNRLLVALAAAATFGDASAGCWVATGLSGLSVREGVDLARDGFTNQATTIRVTGQRADVTGWNIGSCRPIGESAVLCQDIRKAQARSETWVVRPDLSVVFTRTTMGYGPFDASMLFTGQASVCR